MYSGEYDACDVTLSVYAHRASLKNMPDHGGESNLRPLWESNLRHLIPEPAARSAVRGY